MTTDLLLLNATNYQPNLIFPYAFVQVRAVARRHGLRVQSCDLFGHDPLTRPEYLRDLIQRLRPKAVGFHVRQADSLVPSDYLSAQRAPYFPLESTRQAIREVRQAHEGPVVLGGIGFSTNPAGVLQHLEADLGVIGEPDAFFAQFERALAGEAVANVIAPRQPLGSREYFGPLAEREYDEEVLAEMERFYGCGVLYGPAGPCVAVELSRGCPFRCSFCAEPAVKGRRVQVRDLDAVFADIEFLVRRGIHSFWLVCSELNHGSSELAQQVARRFLALRERHPERPLLWRAYLLPRWLSDADMELLHRSGFCGGWNDFPALDDLCLSESRVPYRTRHIHEHLEQTLALHARDAEPSPASLGLFLGNAHATPGSIVRSLDYFDQHFYGRFARAQVGTATRLLATMDGDILAALEPNAASFAPQGTLPEVDITLPTFALPPALTEVLGPGFEPAREFFEYVRTSLLSREFEAEQDWPRFMRASLSAVWVRESLSRLRLAPPPEIADTPLGQAIARACSGAPGALGEWLDPPPERAALAAQVLGLLAHRLAARCPAAARVSGWLGFTAPRDLSPWKLLRASSQRADTLGELEQGLLASLPVEVPEEERGAAGWLLRYYAFRHGLRLQPNFARLVRQGLAQRETAPRRTVRLRIAAATPASEETPVCLQA